MQRKTLWRSWLAVGSLALVASCGGGELIAVLGFIGSAGGSWLQDDQPSEQAGQVGLQLRSNCGQSGDADCFINIQPADGNERLYEQDFDLSYTSNLPGCATAGTGRASGKRLVLNGCFSGEYVTVNQALSDNAQVRMFFDFTPVLSEGIWVEIQEGRRRFGFNDDSRGCELTSPAATPVLVSVSRSQVRNPAGPFETTLSSFAIQGGGAAWQGRFVGISGLRLTRGNEVLELERRAGVHGCP